MELRAIWAIVWRRKWYMLAAFLVVVLTAFAGSAMLPDFYDATARFAISATGADISLLSSIGMRDAAPKSARTDSEMANRIALATVDPLLTEVIEKLQLRDGKGVLRTPERLMKIALLSGRPSMKLEQIADTRLVRVRARSRDPAEAAMMANTLAEIYTEDNRHQRRKEYRRAREFVEVQLEQAKKEYLSALAGIRDFQVATASVDLKMETQAAISRMADLLKEKENTVVLLDQGRAKLAVLKKQLQGQDPASVASSAIGESRQILYLKNTLSDLEVEHAGLLADKRTSHPEAVALARRIDNVRKQLANEMHTFRQTSTSLQDMERDNAALVARLAALNDEVGRHIARLSTLPAKTFTDSQLQLKYSVNRDLYNSLLQYLNQIGIAEAMTLSDIEIVQAASVPDIDKPKGPKRANMRIMGTFMGVLAALCLGFLIEYLDDTIKTPEDASEQGLTVLGTIPRFSVRKGVLISGKDPRAPICEAYRTVRNSIGYALPDKQITSMLVTSPMASEGKTTTVANLGISVAREGKRVLLFDTDLRKPQIHALFGLPNTNGVTGILLRDVPASEAVQTTDTDGLFVMVSGPPPPDPARLVESAGMRQLINACIEEYDMVILDSPPVMAANDAIVLAGYVDGCVSVLESGKETRRALAQEKKLMTHAGIEPLGLVLNKFRAGHFGYYYYYSYYRSRYYQDDSKT